MIGEDVPETNENEQQEQTLRRLVSLSEEQVDGLIQLLDDQPHLSDFVASRKAFRLVFGSIKRALTWIASFVGLVWLGFDKVKDILKYIVDTIVQLVA